MFFHSYTVMECMKTTSMDKPQDLAEETGEHDELWLALEYFVHNTHPKWLALIGFGLILMAFVVTGVLLSTMLFLITFYNFVNEQSHIDTLTYN